MRVSLKPQGKRETQMGKRETQMGEGTDIIRQKEQLVHDAVQKEERQQRRETLRATSILFPLVFFFRSSFSQLFPHILTRSCIYCRLLPLRYGTSLRALCLSFRLDLLRG